MTTEEPRPVPAAPSLVEVTARQIAAVDAFHRARRVAEQAAAAAASSREMRMDLARRVEVMRREHHAIMERAEHALRDSGRLLARRAPTAFVAHRQEWFTGKVTGLLQAHGVDVLGRTDVGADMVGWALAEQPDLVLVDDTLAMLPGVDVVRQIRRYCDTTVIGATVGYSDRIQAMLDAGASTVHVRAVPPAKVVDDLMALLAS
jgi:CheY-like chemotaxis protein